MKEVYDSKKGFAIYLPMGIIGVLFVLTIFFKQWPAVVILAVVGAFIMHMFFNTYYTITADQLIIKCSFVVNITMNIADIIRVVPSGSILSSPALSTDRLEIFYNKYDSVLISPEDKEGFIARLKQINPEIITG